MAPGSFILVSGKSAHEEAPHQQAPAQAERIGILRRGFSDPRLGEEPEASGFRLEFRET